MLNADPKKIKGSAIIGLSLISLFFSLCPSYLLFYRACYLWRPLPPGHLCFFLHRPLCFVCVGVSVVHSAYRGKYATHTHTHSLTHKLKLTQTAWYADAHTLSGPVSVVVRHECDNLGDALNAKAKEFLKEKEDSYIGKPLIQSTHFQLCLSPSLFYFSPPSTFPPPSSLLSFPTSSLLLQQP